MRAQAVFHLKFYLEGQRYVIEMEVLNVNDPIRFPDGVRYGLVCIDQKTGMKVLIENHYPKGHHLHIGQVESPYDYQGIDQLIEDFKRIVDSEIGVKL